MPASACCAVPPANADGGQPDVDASQRQQSDRSKVDAEGCPMPTEPSAGPARGGSQAAPQAHLDLHSNK